MLYDPKDNTCRVACGADEKENVYGSLDDDNDHGDVRENIYRDVANSDTYDDKW